MAITKVALSSNGVTKSHTPATAVPLIGVQIDRLGELRATLRALETEERTLTASISTTLHAAGLTSAQGRRSVARLEVRTIQKVDPELFLELTGPKGLTAMSVSITAARKLVVEADLAAISERTEQRALRVDALPSVPVPVRRLVSQAEIDQIADDLARLA